MKKLKSKIITLVCLFACLLVIPTSVYAAGEAVTISAVSANTAAVTISGTSDALAVMVQVRDASDNIIIMKSFGTVSGAFAGTIDHLSLTAGTTYTIYAADYEGGEWTKTNVVATALPTPATPDTSASTDPATTPAAAESAAVASENAAVSVAASEIPKSPKTGDINITWSIIGMVVGIAFIGEVMLTYRKKR